MCICFLAVGEWFKDFFAVLGSASPRASGWVMAAEKEGGVAGKRSRASWRDAAADDSDDERLRHVARVVEAEAAAKAWACSACGRQGVSTHPAGQRRLCVYCFHMGRLAKFAKDLDVPSESRAVAERMLERAADLMSKDKVAMVAVRPALQDTRERSAPPPASPRVPAETGMAALPGAGSSAAAAMSPAPPVAVENPLAPKLFVGRIIHR